MDNEETIEMVSIPKSVVKSWAGALKGDDCTKDEIAEDIEDFLNA